MGGFIKDSSSDSYVLLGGGGHSLLKTINGNSLFGSGNIVITSSSGGGDGNTQYYLTLNNAINGHSSGTNLGTFFAPISGGTAGLYLKSNGATSAPTWASFNFASSSHSHTLKIETTSDTSQIALAASTKYKLTAGGSTYVFTTPADTTSSGGTSASGTFWGNSWSNGGSLSGKIAVSADNWAGLLVLNRTNNSTNWGASIVFQGSGNNRGAIHMDNNELYVGPASGSARYKVLTENNWSSYISTSGGPDGNDKVYQAPTSGSNANYRVLFKYTANDTAETTYVRSCTNLYYNMSTYKLTNNGEITATLFVRGGSSVWWVNGRKSALLRETSNDGYHAIWSLKTTNGSWDCGELSDTGWTNKLVLSYISDTDYNNQNNATTYQIIFPQKSGTVALLSDISTSSGGGYIATTAVQTNSTAGQNITGTGSITPYSNNSYNLGGSSAVFATTYTRIVQSDSALYFKTNGANTRMYINTSGNVGIGTTSPLRKLHVIGEAIFGDSNYTAPQGTGSGYSGTWMGQGWMELSATDPYIDFHKSKSTADFTSRLIHWNTQIRLKYENSDTTYSGYVLTCEGNHHNPVILGIFDLRRWKQDSTSWSLDNICGPCYFELKNSWGSDVSYHDSNSYWTIPSNLLRVEITSTLGANYTTKTTVKAAACIGTVMTRWINNQPVVANRLHGDWQGCSVECLCTDKAPGYNLYYDSQSPGKYIYITGARPWGYDDGSNGLGMDQFRQTGNLSYQRVRFVVYGWLE